MSSPSPEIKSKAVRAGAGAGKTYNLTHQVLDFSVDYFERNKKWPHIMVTTFTKKATQELSERLVQLSIQKYPQAIDFTTSSLFLKISTIHGILDKFLKEHGHCIDLCGDFTYLKKSDTRFLSKKILKDLLEAHPHFYSLLEAFPFSKLNQLLMSASYQDLNQMRIINKSDLEILLLKELKKCRLILESFLEQAESMALPDKWKSVLQNLQKIHTGLDDWPQQRNFILDLLEELSLVGLKSKKMPDSYLMSEQLASIRDELRKKMTSSSFDSNTFDFVEKLNESFDQLRKVYQHKMVATKKATGKIDISDLEIFTLDLIRNYPQMARAFSQNWDYWLIDEFQDTSPTQVEILNHLVQNKPHYVVGDPQQSIYLFRGARSEVFDKKMTQIQNTGGVVDSLDTNYRSTPHLLHFINCLAKNLPGEFQAMQSPAAVQGARSVCEIRIINDPKKGEDSLELPALKDYIVSLKNKGVSYGDIAILVRRNKELEKVCEYLRAHRIPILQHSGGLFWKRREVQDMLIVFKFLINPFDRLNLVNFLRHPLVGVSEPDIVSLVSGKSEDLWSKVKNHFEAGRAGQSGQKILHWFLRRTDVGVVEALQRLVMDLGFFDTHLWRDESERIEGNQWKFIYLLRKFESERGANFVKFINEAERAMETEKVSDAIGSIDKNKVNVMTVHASKGLQFSYVLLPFLGQAPYQENKMDFIIDEENKIWSIRTPADEEELKTSASLFEKLVIQKKLEKELAENSRVFYVAFTRAKLGLYLSWESPPAKHSWADQIKNLNLSEGTHEENLFTYRVDHFNNPASDEEMDVSTAHHVPTPLKDLRMVYASSPPENTSKAVTTHLNAGHFKSYHHSFLNKQNGILFHRLVEILKYPVDVNISDLVLRWFPDSHERVADALQFILKQQEVPLKSLIQEGQVEWPFVFLQPGGERIEGQIDLWCVYNNQLWIVDYKSGEKVFKEKSFQQLNIYARALKDFLHWEKPIQLVVVYPFLEEIYQESYADQGNNSMV